MKIQVTVTTGYAGCEYQENIELDEENFIGMTEEQKESFLQGVALDYVFEKIDYGYRIIEELK